MIESCTLEMAVERIDASLAKAEEWSEITGGRTNDIEQIRKRREELKDILTELSWRYGRKNICFFFSKKKHCPEGSVSITDLIETETYKNRIFVKEEEGGITYVFIRF